MWGNIKTQGLETALLDKVSSGTRYRHRLLSTSQPIVTPATTLTASERPCRHLGGLLSSAARFSAAAVYPVV
jgi:hypothetical protein